MIFKFYFYNSRQHTVKQAISSLYLSAFCLRSFEVLQRAAQLN